MGTNQFGDFVDLDPDPPSSNFVDPDPDNCSTGWDRVHGDKLLILILKAGIESLAASCKSIHSAGCFRVLGDKLKSYQF